MKCDIVIFEHKKRSSVFEQSNEQHQILYDDTCAVEWADWPFRRCRPARTQSHGLCGTPSNPGWTLQGQRRRARPSSKECRWGWRPTFGPKPSNMIILHLITFSPFFSISESDLRERWCALTDIMLLKKIGTACRFLSKATSDVFDTFFRRTGTSVRWCSWWKQVRFAIICIISDHWWEIVQSEDPFSWRGTLWGGSFLRGFLLRGSFLRGSTLRGSL